MAVAATVDAYRRLDVLVNNAGRHDFRITTDVTEEDGTKASPSTLAGGA